MKSNMEQNFKDAFEEYELPYNSSAWNALNDKLDKLQAPAKVTPSNNWKWISGVAVLAVVATAVVYMTSQNEEKTIENKSIAEQTTTVITQNEVVENESVATQTNGTETPNNITVETKLERRDNSVNTNPTTERRTTERVNESNSNPEKPAHLEMLPLFDLTFSEKIHFPEIAEVCAGSVVAVPNKNKTAIVLISPSGKETEIKASSSNYITLSEAGTYSFAAKNSSETSSFSVKDAPKVDFTIDMGYIYEDGIPSIALQALAEGTNFVWTFEGSNIKQKGSQAKAHFYKKGAHEVTLTAKGTNGCEASVSKNVTIESDYNLLAPEGFEPTNDNPKRNRFIPAALLDRKTDFKLYIIEPRSGVVIFETNSLEGWNGVDKNTNQLVEENKSFIWKVVLVNPEPEEKREYKGIVTRL